MTTYFGKKAPHESSASPSVCKRSWTRGGVASRQVGERLHHATCAGRVPGACQRIPEASYGRAEEESQRERRTPQEFLPTWREELKAVLKAYAAVAVAGAQRRSKSGGASAAGAEGGSNQPTDDEEDMYGAL